MTNSIPTIPSVIQALEDIMNSEASLEEMETFSEKLNKLPEIDSRIKQKFYENLSFFDSAKIRRSLDFIEYLTVHSPSKLAQFILDEKFIQLFPYTLSEDDLRDPALNLLKLWTETYQDERKDMALVFDFIENLDMFDIHLPPVYIPSYEKNVKIKRQNYAQSYPYTGMYPATYPPRSGSSSKIDSLIERATELRDRAKAFLEDKKNYKNISTDDQIQYLTSITNFLGQFKQICLEASNTTASDVSNEEGEKIQDLLSELNTYEIRFRKKIYELDEEDNAPENDYRILISDSDNLGFDGAVMETMLNMQDFVAYKTHPCPKAIDCPYFDFTEEQSGYMRDQIERKCPYWHSDNDRRRSVFTENKSTSYAPRMCPFPKTCVLGDKCHFSHNFFESFFHPDKYKTDLCADSASACIGEKYCSSYHSEHEKDIWRKMLANYECSPKSTHNEAMNNSDDLAGWNPDDIDIENVPVKSGFYPGNTLMNPEMHEYPPRKKEEHKYSNGKVNGVTEEEKRQFVEMKGHLHSTLTIRKNYNSPSVYTNFFQKNGCFNGVPLFDLKEFQSGKQI